MITATQPQKPLDRSSDSSVSIERVFHPSSIPAQLAEYDRFPDWKQAFYLNCASAGPGSSYPREKWDACTKEEQQYAVDSLNARGIDLVIEKGRVFTISQDQHAFRPCVTRVRPDCEFIIDDPRIRNGQEVVIRIMNARTAHDARRILQEFLNDICEHGVSTL